MPNFKDSAVFSEEGHRQDYKQHKANVEMEESSLREDDYYFDRILDASEFTSNINHVIDNRFV